MISFIQEGYTQFYCHAIIFAYFIFAGS